MILSLIEESAMSSPSLLAWCSYDRNKIDIIDIDTKQSYASFDGVNAGSGKA